MRPSGTPRTGAVEVRVREAREPAESPGIVSHQSSKKRKRKTLLGSKKKKRNPPKKSPQTTMEGVSFHALLS